MRTDYTRGWKRLFLAATVVHLCLSALLLIASLGEAMAAHEGDASSGSTVILTLTDFLTGPIVLARMLLPESIAPGFSPQALLLNSLLWAGAVVGLVVGWRRWRHRPPA